jgi:hypothetical protein
LGGYLSDHFGAVPVILAACFTTGPIIYLINLVPYGLGFTAVIDETSERYRSTILGIYFFSGHEGSGVLTPVMGLLIDHLGFSSSFTIAGVALVGVTLACSVFLLRGQD